MIENGKRYNDLSCCQSKPHTLMRPLCTSWRTAFADLAKYRYVNFKDHGQTRRRETAASTREPRRMQLYLAGTSINIPKSESTSRRVSTTILLTHPRTVRGCLYPYMRLEPHSILGPRVYTIQTTFYFCEKLIT